MIQMFKSVGRFDKLASATYIDNFKNTTYVKL